MSASGKMLKPLVIFKGKPGARIETREFRTYDQSMYYACQESAWMDERVMRVWVQRVLKPYVEEVPLHITSLLILDSYRCHTTPTVVSEIQALGCEIEIIPGGCTGLCQLIDVGIRKPLKSRARHLWEEWMVQECTANNAAATRPPSRLLMSQWISASINRILETPSMIRNSWRHAEYSYFPNETVADVVAAKPPAGGGNEEQDGDNSIRGGEETDGNGGGVETDNNVDF